MKAQRQFVGRDQTAFVFEFDAPSLRAAAFVLFGVLWMYTALLTLPFGYNMPDKGLDPSHQFGSNYFPNAGFKYGSDLIFTYGPLGYLVYPEHVGNHIAVANAVRAAVWLLLVVHIVLLCRLGVNGFCKSLLLMAALAAVRNLLLSSFDYYMVAVLLVLVIYLIERPNAWPAQISVVVIVGVLGLVKFTAYVLALGGAGLLLTMSMSPARGIRLSRRDVYFGLATGIALPVAFLVHNFSVRGLVDYLYGLLQLSSGYNEALSLPSKSEDLFYVMISGTALSAGVIYACIRRALTWKAAPVLLFLTWISFKHGFVRDGGHCIYTFCFEIMLAAVLICLLRRGSQLILPYVVAFPFFVVVGLSGINVHWQNVWTEAFWSSANTRQPAADLLDWTATASRINEAAKTTDEFRTLPQELRARLQDSTVTVFPWEVAYARSGQFKLQPLYTMQAYSASTQYLDRKTAGRLAAKRSEYVLFDWESIDERHPLLDVPATWMALVDNYELAEVASRKLVLKRRSAPVNHRQHVLQEFAFPIGKWIDLPDTKTNLWARLLMPYSILGTVRKTIYKTRAVYLSVRSGETTARFRVVPGVLSSAFPLTALPVDLDGFVNLLRSGRIDAPITRIRLDVESPSDFSEPTLQLLEETESQLTFSNSSEHLQQRFLTAPSPENSGGGLDVVNENEIGGWAWDRSNPNGHVQVEIRADGTVLDRIGAVQFRRDLLEGGFGSGDYMFRYPTPLELKDGKAHTIRAMIVGTNLELPGSPKTLITKP